MRVPSLALLLVIGACAPAEKQTRKDALVSTNGSSNGVAMAAAFDAQNMMLQMRAAKGEAEKGCEPQRARTPAFAEERAIGLELSITRVGNMGHLHLDGATETDPRKLVDQLAARTAIVLPEGPKNALSARVALVGRHLARYSARPDLPWVFAVIENDTAFSFSEPGGFVFISTALLKKLTNEAQLAGVLGHEISHVVKKDALGQYLDARYKQCIAAKYAAALIAAGGPRSMPTEEVARFAHQFDRDLSFDGADEGFNRFLLRALISLSEMGFDKATEFAHDKAALELLSFAGYDATEYEKFLANTPMPQHPAGAERATRLQALREGEFKDIATGTAKPDLSKLLAP